MEKEEIIKKISSKKEFSKLREKDIYLAFSHFENRQTSDEEKIKLTRELLHKTFGAFGSQKLLSGRSLEDKPPEWFLRKHLSTRERIDFYPEIYSKIFKHIPKKSEKLSIIDLGSGVNFFSYPYIDKKRSNLSYFVIESIGQFVDLAKIYFRKSNLLGDSIHLSLFELNLLKRLIKKEKSFKIVFLFKVIDSLELLSRDYSKKLLLELTPLVDLFILSLPVESMVKRTKFKAKRYWILNFIKENFWVLDEFKMGSEQFLIFKKINKSL
ncbi:hypothetical protein K0A97_02540 [Patescibacteria group bacterium]|nr:hypothetical protein [Patescibacteria group bacterium]